MITNDYIPFSSQILEVIRHTDIEYTFRMAYEGQVKPGQFFEVSIPKYGEAPISVSGIGEGYVDLTIRRVGKVTGEVFERYVGDTLLLRGPYGNGFRIEDYAGKDIVVMAGGTGLSFQAEEDYVPPVWPEEPGEQQKSEHMDFLVDHLKEAEAHALACGAVRSPQQFLQGVTVFFDPDGHPFCLFEDPSYQW